MKRGVVRMKGYERWGFDEVSPLFADTLELEKGFHWKAFDNVGDDCLGKRFWLLCHCYGLARRRRKEKKKILEWKKVLMRSFQILS